MVQKIIVEQVQKDPFKYCLDLEAGNLLFFPKIPFEVTEEEIALLKEGKATDSYAKRVEQFLAHILSPYASQWKRVEETVAQKGHLRIESSRPRHGARTLRFFTNFHPSQIWKTSQPFGSLMEQFGGVKGVPYPKTMDYSLKGRLERKFKELLCSTGLKISLRSPYDSFMLRMDRFLRKNDSFQKNSPKAEWEFPQFSCFAFYTDLVSHADLTGTLQQTFLIPQKALLCPEKSPVAILQRLSGRNMVDLNYLTELFK